MAKAKTAETKPAETPEPAEDEAKSNPRGGTLSEGPTRVSGIPFPEKVKVQ